MILALIGMSGVGKTSWANKLADAGFTCLHCDDMIATRLRAHADIAAGSVYDVGRWMGLPYEPQFAGHEATYLAYETDILREIATTFTLDNPPAHQLVIDLTGSAIYVDSAILHAIRRAATVVYLSIAPERRDEMVQAYIAHPRPVIWNGMYQPHTHEDPTAALARCYVQLIAAREHAYEQFSHLRLDEALHRQPSFAVDDFLAYVAQAHRQDAS